MASGRLKRAFLRSAFLTLLIGSAFVGIGGLGLEGSGASDLQIRGLWTAAGVIAVAAFVITFVVNAIRARTNQR